MLAALVQRHADAKITNNDGENALHFLGNLDDLGCEIRNAAVLLIVAGAEIDADASAYTGNTYLGTRPTGKGCPRLRAAMLNQPHVLRVLLELSPDAQTPVVPSSTLSAIIGRSVRLSYPAILEVLEQSISVSSTLTNLAETRLWSHGTPYSPIELWVLGSASSCASSGFNLPNRFWRYINHADRHEDALRAALLWLQNYDTRFMILPCLGARNPTFYTVKEGKRDALKCLMAQSDRFEMDFTVTLSREEVRSKLTLRERKKRKKSHYDEEEWQRNLRSINSLPQLRKQFYKDHLPKSLLGTNKLDIYHPFCRFDRWGFEIPTQSGDIEPSDDDHDDDDQLRKFDVETERTSFACPMPQDASEPAKQPDDAEGTPPLPENHQRLEGLVDATLLAILCGRRHISYDLITGPGSATLLPGSYITQANPRTFPDAV